MTSPRKLQPLTAAQIRDVIGTQLFGKGLLKHWLGGRAVDLVELSRAFLELAVASNAFADEDEERSTMDCIHMLTQSLFDLAPASDSPAFVQWHKEVSDLLAQMAGEKPTSLN